MNTELLGVRESVLQLFEDTIDREDIPAEILLQQLAHINATLDELDNQLVSSCGILSNLPRKRAVVIFSVYGSGRNLLESMLGHSLRPAGYRVPKKVYHFDNYRSFVADRILASLHPAGLASHPVGEALRSGLCNQLKMICVFRDLRDVAVSVGLLHKGSGIRLDAKMSDDEAIEVTIKPDLKRILNAPDGNLGDWKGSRIAAEDLRYYLRNPHIYPIRFEDLKARPEEELKRLLLFLGYTRSEQEIKESVEFGSFERATGRKPGDEDRKHHFRRGISGEWKSRLSASNKQLLKEEAGKMMLELGLVPDLDW